MKTKGTQAEVAAHLDMTVENFRILIRKGVIQKTAKQGQYDLDVCRLAYIRHLRETAAGRGGDNELAKQRTRKEMELADRAAMQNARMRGELVHREECIAAGQAIIATAKDRLRLMPSKLTPILQSMDDPGEIAELLRDHVDEALNELAAFNDSPRTGRRNGSRVGAATKAKRQRLGRPRKGP